MAVLTLDAGGRITAVHGAAAPILGVDREDLVGAVLWPLLPPGLAAELQSLGDRATAAGGLVTAEVRFPPPLDTWCEVHVLPETDGVALVLLDATAHRDLRRRAEQATARARLLGQVTEQLATTLEPEQAAARLCRLVVPALADWSVVTLLDDDRPVGTRRALRHAAACHRDPDRQRLAERYATARLTAFTDDALLLRAIRTGRPEFLPAGATRAAQQALRPGPARDLIGALAPEHIAVLPLPGRLGPVGLLSLYAGADRGPLGPADLAVAADVAARAGLVLDNARLYRQQRSLAEALQRAMLSDPAPVAGLQIAVRYTPAALTAQVGGDWYDAFRQHGGATLVIGDVAGHDSGAAAAMGQLRSLLRGIAVATGAGPADLLRAVDAAMAALQIPTLATAIVAHLQPPQAAPGPWRLRWSNAGHPPPILLHPDGSATVLHTPPNRLLGVGPGADRTETDLLLDPGATLLLYTDGLIERRDRPLDDGIAVLRRTLDDLAAAASQSPSGLEDLGDALLTRLLCIPPADDVALLAVRVAL